MARKKQPKKRGIDLPLISPRQLDSDEVELETLFGIMVDYNKEGALMETGYSTFIPIWGEVEQEIYVNCALPIIRNMVREHSENNPTIPMLLGNWYELMDGNSNNWIPVPPWIWWDHFGLVRSDNYEEKLAYDDFRAWVAAYEF